MLVFPRQSPPGAPPGAPLGGPPPPTLGPGPGPFPVTYQPVPLLNQRAPLLALTITFIVLSWICCLLRLYVRFIVQRAPGWDDFFLVLAMISTTMGSIVLCIMADMGLGKHVLTLSLPEIQNILKATYIGTFTYPLSATFIKVALLLQYLRVFKGPRIRMLCKGMLIISVPIGLGFAICSWFSCFPVAAFWDLSIQGARCWGFASHDQLEFMRITVTQVVIAAALDFIVFLIPTWLYFQPNTQKATRLSLLGLFALGLCANLCSLWRVAYVVKLSAADKTPFDPTWDNPTVMGLASFEFHLAAVCAALPVFWPVLKKTWNRIFVTFEVSVTQEYGVLPSKKASDIELRAASQQPGWVPFVGDETTGLGENETVIQSLPAAKRSRNDRNIFRIDEREPGESGRDHPPLPGAGSPSGGRLSIDRHAGPRLAGRH